MKKKFISATVLLSCLIGLNNLADASRTVYANDAEGHSLKQNTTVVSTHKSTDKVVSDSLKSNDKKEMKKTKTKVKEDTKQSTDTFRIDNKIVSKKEFEKQKYKKTVKDKKGGKKKAQTSKPEMKKTSENAVKRPVYEVIDGKTYVKGTLLPDDYKEISVYGEAVAQKSQALAFLKANNAEPKINCSAEQMVDIYWNEATLEGIRPDIAFCQALLETGFFSYGGDVIPSQNNFCGLGTTGGGVKGAFFKTPELGARAHIQHLLAYARIVPPRTEIVDPRYKLVHGIRMERGLINNWSGLNGTWAMGGYYCEKILAHYQNMLAMPIEDKQEEKPTKINNENHKMRNRVDKILHEKK